MGVRSKKPFADPPQPACSRGKPLLDCALSYLKASLPPRTARIVFRRNETHRQQDIFGIETQIRPDHRKRLRESKEYAFYERVFSRIPEEHFADLYSGAPA